MNIKKSLSMLVILLISAIVFVACSGDGNNNESSSNSEPDDNFNATDYPIVDESITLEMMGKSSPIQPEWGDMGFFQEMEKLTNIKFEFRTASADDFTQNKQLAFASLDLPDLFYGAELTAGEEADYGSQGLLIPLEDLIEDYAPNFKKLMDENPDLAASITTPDGHIYALPGIDESVTSKTPIMWMNGPWLDELGVDKPETMEDFYEILKAFKEEDPGNVGDVIPLTANAPADLRIGLLPNFGIVQDDGIYEEDGEVKFAWVQDEYKEYLKYMNRLYEEELLDNEMFSHTWEQFVAKGPKTGILSTWPIVMVGFEDPMDALNYPVLPPMTSATNDEKLTTLMSEIRRGRAAITNENEHPEATMRWIDHAYSEEGTMLSRLGIEGETYEFNEDDQWVLLAEDGLSTTETNAKHAPGVGTNVPMNLTEEFFAQEGGNPAILEIYEWVSEELIPYGKLPYPQVYFTDEEQKEINIVKPDIDSYFQQMEAKFITGAEDIDAMWDEYVSTLEKQGIGDLVEAHQSAYDRWAEAQ
ncbi:extracellular solute-binding protein [Ornithinibacillus halophilus]|uniref:Carbohydrate ABC transporter substrate-binding protein, CUT1 family n=1 Tax=Ornithinibacillus halophilus TaxID=930117 RepID=A0A1M5K2I6_9BACI|nr:extracellular solute-binding protein [Ornithinibacillus halophilus]SHG46987.1 carbohydrate ABC transporter substrate-binding protein, CUT1 family [Ornithinibacillus halophilus]